MRKELKEVLWDWLPGIVAGLMPLAVFALVAFLKRPVALPADHPALHYIRDGWIAHLLVLAIVISTVCNFTTMPKLFTGNGKGDGPRRAMVGFVMFNTIILVFGVAFYTVHEFRVTEIDLTYLALGIAALAAAVSLVIEFTAANMRLPEPATKPAVNGEAAIPFGEQP